MRDHHFQAITRVLNECAKPLPPNVRRWSYGLKHGEQIPQDEGSPLAEGYMIPVNEEIPEDRNFFGNPDKRNAEAEKFIAAVGVKITTEIDFPSYTRRSREITIPPFSRFTSSAAYYSALFHEMTHYALHLLMIGVSNSGSFEGYASEEISAQLGSEILCARFGIVNTVDSASYIKHFKNEGRLTRENLLDCTQRAEIAAGALEDFYEEYLKCQNV